MSFNGQSFVRPRMGGVAGYVEYDGPRGVRTRKAFDNVAGNQARRFYIQKSMAGKNPRVVKA